MTLTKRGVAGEAVVVDPSAKVNHAGVGLGVLARVFATRSLDTPKWELWSAQMEIRCRGRGGCMGAGAV